MNCTVCAQPLDPALAPEVTHPSCSADSMWLDQDVPDPFNDILKQKLIRMIMWAENESPRSKQAEIGPSEVGGGCDRHIAYRLAGVAPINIGFDPWPAVVGTAVHAWLETAVRDWCNVHHDDGWRTETTLDIGGIAKGHSDLYHDGTVIDWKTAGPDVMKKVRADGPPDAYVIQAQVYGLGFEQAGMSVERVALAFLPRAGWLRDMYVWSAPYSRELAEAAMARVLYIAETTFDLDVFTNPHRWNQIPAEPSDTCGRCPWFNSIITKEQGASDRGCPAA